MRAAGPLADEASPGPASPEPEQTVEGGLRSEEAPSSVSSFELARRTILGLIDAIENGVELAGATLREELAHFRRELEHSLVAVFFLVGGLALATTGAVLLLREAMGDWAFVTLGVAYLGVGLWLRSPRAGAEGGGGEGR